MKNYLLVAILFLSMLSGCQGPTGSSNVIPNSIIAEYIKSDKKAAELNMQMGLNYFQRGDYETALGKLEKALKQDPSLSGEHKTIAISYQRLNEQDKDEYHYKQAVSLAPKYSEAQNNYGVYLCGQGRYEESVPQFLAAIQNPLYRSLGQAHENAGLCARGIPDIERAEQYLRKALQTNPKLGKSLLAMAEISCEQGDYLTSPAYIERYRNAARWTPQALMQAVNTEIKLVIKMPWQVIASYYEAVSLILMSQNRYNVASTSMCQEIRERRA